MFTRPFSWTITALLLTGVAACAQVEYPKAIVDVPDMEKAIALAKELDRKKDQPPPEGTRWFEIKRGTLPAVITAPHATEPFREGQFRFSDGGGTGGLADALNAICDVTVVYTTYRSPSDPNFYDDNEFKVSLGELISEIKPAILLDVHASHPYRPYDVDLGTMNGSSVLGDTFLIRALIDAFSMEGILSISVDWFAASKDQTVIKYASLKGVPSVQLEFSATRTTPPEMTHLLRIVLPRLSRRWRASWGHEVCVRVSTPEMLTNELMKPCRPRQHFVYIGWEGYYERLTQ